MLAKVHRRAQRSTGPESSTEAALRNPLWYTAKERCGHDDIWCPTRTATSASVGRNALTCLCTSAEVSPFAWATPPPAQKIWPHLSPLSMLLGAASPINLDLEGFSCRATLSICVGTTKRHRWRASAFLKPHGQHSWGSTAKHWEADDARVEGAEHRVELQRGFRATPADLRRVAYRAVCSR